MLPEEEKHYGHLFTRKISFKETCDWEKHPTSLLINTILYQSNIKQSKMDFDGMCDWKKSNPATLMNTTTQWQARSNKNAQA
jgi:hypothetical protein